MNDTPNAIGCSCVCCVDVLQTSCVISELCADACVSLKRNAGLF